MCFFGTKWNEMGPLFTKMQQEEILKCVSWLLWFLLLLPKPAFAFPIGRWSFHAPAENPWHFYFLLIYVTSPSVCLSCLLPKNQFYPLEELPSIFFTSKDTDKKKSSFPHTQGNSEWGSCKVIYEEGVPNIWGNAQIFNHVWGSR